MKRYIVLFALLSWWACSTQAQLRSDRGHLQAESAEQQRAPWDDVISGLDNAAATPINTPLFNFLGGLAYRDVNESTALFIQLFDTDQATAQVFLATVQDALINYKNDIAMLEANFCARRYPSAEAFAGAMAVLDAQHAVARTRVITNVSANTDPELWSDIVEFASDARSSTTTRTTDYYVWIQHNDYTRWLSRKCG